MQVFNLQTRGVWLEFRTGLGTLGASSAACIISKSFDGAWGVFAEWHGLPDKPTKHARQGLTVEPLTAFLYEQSRPGVVVNDPGHMICVGPETWAHASPDRLAMDPSEEHPNGLLELKDHRHLPYMAWGDGGEIVSHADWKEQGQPIKLYELVQVYWQMWCTGARWVDLAALLPRRGLISIYRVRRDERAIRAIVGKLRPWYRAHLLEGVEPRVDDTDGCYRWLAHRAAMLEEGKREATPAELEAAQNYREARATEKQAAADKSRARAALLDSMCPKSGGQIKRITDEDGRQVASITKSGGLTVSKERT